MNNMCKLIHSPRKWVSREMPGGYKSVKLIYDINGKTKTLKIIRATTQDKPQNRPTSEHP